MMFRITKQILDIIIFSQWLRLFFIQVALLGEKIA